MTKETLDTRLLWVSQSYLEMCRDVLCWINSDDTIRDQTYLQVLGRINRVKAEMEGLARRLGDEPKNRG